MRLNRHAIGAYFEVDPGAGTMESPKLRCDRACLCPSNQAASCCCCFCVCCGYVGNAFALSKRSGISTVFAASILSMPARHAAMGNWLFIAWCGRRWLYN